MFSNLKKDSAFEKSSELESDRHVMGARFASVPFSTEACVCVGPTCVLGTGEARSQQKETH